MEKTKHDYVAVPTAEPPLYQEEEVEAQQPKRGRRLKFLLIGGAIALIGLGHVCNHKYNEFKENSFDTNPFAYPKEVDNVETGHDLNEFMNHLHYSFSPRPCGMHSNQGPPHGPHDQPAPPPPNGPHRHPPPSPPPHHGPHGPPPPHPPKEPNHSTESFDFSNSRKIDRPAFAKAEDELDSHRKFHGFSNPEEEEEEQKFDGERKLKSHHRGFPKHHNDEPESFDMPPPPHLPHNGMHGHHHPPPGIDLLFDGDEKTRPFSHPPHPENICKVENLNATSTIFSFSPEQFQKTSVFLDGLFSHGSKVLLSKTSDKSIQDVRVNVTLFHGDEDLTKQVALSAFDHKGKYQVKIRRDHHHFRGPHHPHHNQTLEECLVYSVQVQFPANVDYFDSVGLHIKGAHRIEGNLDDIEFGSVKAGLGHGVIHFEKLKAKKMKLGVLAGVVVGNYHVGEKMSAGAFHGGIKLNVFPTAENINVTASAISGPSILNIPSDSYNGKFFVSSIFSDSTIQAPQPEDIHVTKMRRVFMKGYYKEDKDESNILVSSKRKSATLNFSN